MIRRRLNLIDALLAFVLLTAGALSAFSCFQRICLATPWFTLLSDRSVLDVFTGRPVNRQWELELDPVQFDSARSAAWVQVNTTYWTVSIRYAVFTSIAGAGLAGRVIVHRFRRRRSTHPVCEVCSYPRADGSGDACPECGTSW